MIDCLLGICITLSPFFSTYDSTIRSDTGMAVSVGRPFSAWVSYEAPDLKIIGQHVPTKVWGAGLGYSLELTETVNLFMEAGYYSPSTSPKDVVEDEIVYGVLRNDHGKPSFHPTHFEYELEDGYGGRIGLEMELSDRFAVFGAYRFLKFDANYRMCTIESACTWQAPEGEKYWANRDTQSFSSFQIGFSIRI